MVAFIKHIVMFRLKDECGEADLEIVREGLRALPAKIPAIVKHELGADLRLDGGQTHPLGKNRQLAWSVYFEDVSAYDDYDRSDAHREFLRDVMAPRLEPGSRAAIQYEVDA